MINVIMKIFSLTESQARMCLSAIVILMLALVILVCAFVYRKCCERVKGSSAKYKALKELNSRYRFCSIEKIYEEQFGLNSKRQFDNFDYQKKGMELLSEPRYENILDAASENERNYVRYLAEYEALKEIEGNVLGKQGLVLTFYQKLEKHVLNQTKEYPVTNPCLNVSISYTSPKGKNRYHDEYCFTLQEMLIVHENAVLQRKRYTEKQIERRKMSSSIRYDVMKRDQFCCQICGANMDDGAKLHVDHIIPIAKGGKTAITNLRTLCDTCNWGKRDKYDPDGVN